MAKRNEVYKCEICGNIVEVNNGAGGTLVCCGQDMNLLDEKNADSTTEKHVPVIEKIDGGFKVTVGSTLHPMTEEHFIQWIELIADGKSYKEFLKPGDKPEAIFLVSAKKVTAREYCNLHGQWKNEI
ncbi:desulfoferrodoxin [Helicovermis profundi]|uniref:Desulfoferrodoxin n=1 Tax=Helicovermis profundi TaxID=3065157 RepID=A0AAU9E050_9FIRM|nr:desulfoferrodoxin [Clostridia bacterium S502]